MSGKAASGVDESATADEPEEEEEEEMVDPKDKFEEGMGLHCRSVGAFE